VAKSKKTKPTHGKPGLDKQAVLTAGRGIIRASVYYVRHKLTTALKRKDMLRRKKKTLPASITGKETHWLKCRESPPPSFWMQGSLHCNNTSAEEHKTDEATTESRTVRANVHTAALPGLLNS